MRLLFAGTPEPAVPSLRALIETSDHDVVAVLTRPDAQVGRGRRLRPSPVAEVAAEAGIAVLKYARPKDPAFLAQLADLAPDAAAIVAYGGLIPPQALQIPRFGWINLHFSVLPAWRGAAPVQHAIWHGDDVTGASTFLLEEGLDTGPVFGTVTETIKAADTSGDLLHRLAESGAGLLKATLDGIADGTVGPVPQPSDGVSLAPKIEVDDARVDFGQPAVRVDRQVRACTPQPGAWTTFRGERLGLDPVELMVSDAGQGAADGGSATPGQLLVSKRFVDVQTATGPVRLSKVKPQGKKLMNAADWARGVRIEADERLG